MSEEETRDTRSYSERYAQAPEPPPPDPPQPSGSLTTPILALLGVGLLAAAVIAALVLRGGGGPAAVTATPTSAPSTAAPSVGPPATPDANALALQRFWVLIADPKLSYHVETKGGGRIGAEDAYTFSESLDVAGDSWAGTERAHGLGGGGIVSIVTIDPTVWFKFPDGWHKNIEHDPYFRSRPFLDLGTQRDLIVTGTVVKAGKTLYKLESTTNYQPYPGRLIGFFAMGTRVDLLELDILVTADGVPVEAGVHILAGGTGSDGKPVVDAKSTRTFTKFGATFSIKPPKS
jgi:hypothetical protein